MKFAKLALTLVLLTVAPAWADEWVACAIENSFCRVDGTATVRFGADNRWATQNVQGGIPCSRDAFGDPAPGVRKACEVLIQRRAERRDDRRDDRREDRRDDRRDENFDSRTWAKCALEGGYCKFRGTEVVKFGAGRQWATRRANDGIKCTSAAFGDPAVGVQKACYIVTEDGGNRSGSRGDSAGWIKCANETGLCKFNGRRKVSYGVDNRWVYGVHSGSVYCQASAFGSDPAPGVVKACYYESR